MRIVTVSREFGSGGREVGKRLADALGIEYYDREIISAIAKEAEMDAGYVEHVLDNSLHYSYPLTFSHTLSLNYFINSSAPQLLGIQHKIIRGLAEKGDCVIVGRGADAILEMYKPFRIFVYADRVRRVQRVMVVDCISEEKAKKRIRKIENERKNYYKYFTGNDWKNMKNYDLPINTTRLGLDETAELIKEYVKLRGYLK